MKAQTFSIESTLTISGGLDNCIRRLRYIRSRWAYLRSPKPLKHLKHTYMTVFFDHEGRWARPDQAENSKRGVCAILDLLQALNLKATFNVVGQLFLDEASTILRIATDGHEIASHTLAHDRVDHYTPARMKEDITCFREMMKDVGQPLRGFRAPQSRWTFPATLGLLHAGILWNAEYDRSSYPYVLRSTRHKRLWRMPVCADDWAYEAANATPDEVRDGWMRAVQLGLRTGRYIAIGAHPWVIGKSQDRIRAFGEFLAFLTGTEGISVLPFGQVAALCEANIDS